MTKLRLRAVAAAMVSCIAAVALAACGSSTTATTASTAPANASTGSGTTTSAGLPIPAGNPNVPPPLPTTPVIAAVPSLEKLLPPGYAGMTMKIAVTTDLPKVNFPYHGQQRGFEADLLNAAAKQLGLKIDYVVSTNLLESLESGKAMGIAEYTNDTKAREAEGGIYVDYLNTENTAVVPAGNPDHITSNSDLCGKKVAVGQGSTELALIQPKGAIYEACKAAGKPTPTPVIGQTLPAALLSLTSGRADAFLIDTPIGMAMAQADRGKLSIPYSVENPGQPIGITLGSTKKTYASQLALAKALAASYQKLVDDGFYGKVLSSYGITQGLLSKITVNAATR